MRETRLYSVYNGFDNRLLEPETLITAKTSKLAAIEMLSRNNISYIGIKRSGDRYVQVRVMPVHYGANGQLYRDGRVIWYKVF